MTARTKRYLVSLLVAPALSAGPVLAVGSAEAAPVAGPAPVSPLDLNRHFGTWNQLAAVPQYFDLVCARDTQANHALDAQGNSEVRR
ncbi:hypothetical protein [Nocardia iowensis]|uniref:Lipocalin n=1 Tax=Nocardia iowensis TaxID=204891 RepID=A0ABX8RMW4_NOCIO|nr:hypothetical protein [Nocardia iowensis]QXN90229.1 hypothetical protein KV110_33165 [Nocardia iowensis]